MKSTSFKYLAKQGLNALVKNRLMSLASIGVLVVCLILVGAAGLISANVNSMMKYVQAQNEALVLADNDANMYQLSVIESAIKQIENVDTVTFISKDEALEKQKENYGEYAEALDTYMGDANPLSDEFSVTFKDLSKMEETIAELEKIDNVKKVSVMSDVANNIRDFSKVVSVAGVVIIVILIIVAMVIIGNTIKMTVFNRRKEISIMKYVGATDSFIRFPFVVEGATLGLISSAISYILLSVGYSIMYSSLQSNQDSVFGILGQNLIPFSQVWFLLLLFFLLAGISVGLVGSAIFVRKHLKV